MSAFVSNSVILEYGGTTSLTFTTSIAEDDSFDIVSLNKQNLMRSGIENIFGIRYIYTVRLVALTDAQRNFLYNFALNDTQKITINGTQHTVKLRNEEIIDELLSSCILFPSASLEFEGDTLITARNVHTATTTYSSAYRGSSGLGLTAILTFNDGYGDIKRFFTFASVNAYRMKREVQNFEYIDRDRYRTTLGRKMIFDIYTGCLGAQTQAQQQTDRQWINDFCFSNNKHVFVPGVYGASVVNGFDKVVWNIEQTIYGKSTSLQFIEKDLGRSAPVAGDFVLDTSTLDTGVLL
jgi:hypothetical protein